MFGVFALLLRDFLVFSAAARPTHDPLPMVAGPTIRNPPNRRSPIIRGVLIKGGSYNQLY